MLPLLSDENLNGQLVRGLARRRPDLDIIRVQDVGLMGADDRAILTWAADNGRVLLTHDRATVPAFAFERVQAGERMPGVIVVDNRASLAQAIDDILLFALCSEAREWDGQVLFL